MNSSILPKLLLASVLSSGVMADFSVAAEVQAPVMLSSSDRLPEIRQRYQDSFKPENAGERAWWRIEQVDNLARNESEDGNLPPDFYSALGTTEKAYQEHLKENAILAARQALDRVRANMKNAARGDVFLLVKGYLKGAGLDTDTDAAFVPLGITRQQFKEMRAAWAKPLILDQWGRYQENAKSHRWQLASAYLENVKALVYRGYDFHDEDEGFALIGETKKSFEELRQKAFCPENGTRHWLCDAGTPRP